MRAIGYFHIDDGQDPSLDQFEAAFEDYCGLNLHQPVTTFASTVAHAGRDAAEYRRMIDYVRDSGGEFLVVVPTARHLGADLESVARAMVELEGAGLAAVCWDENFPDPLQNAFQTLGVKGVSRTRSRRIKESMSARALKGQALGRPPYGYRIGPDGMLKAVRGEGPDEVRDEAAVVELIFRLYTKDGLGLRLITQHLNERNIPTRRDGGRWSVVSIRDILKNPAYIGTYSRLGMRRANVHEAIIPKDVFSAAQDQTRSRRPIGRVVSSEPFLLSGVAYCQYCGNKMMGVTRRQSWRRKDGRRSSQVYRYYQCQSRNNQSLCAYHTWRAALLEGAVISQLRQALRARPEGSPEDHAARRAAVQAAKSARAVHAERRFLRAMRKAASGEITVGILGQYLEELDAARAASAGASSPRDIDEVFANWDGLGMEDRRDFLEEHVRRIVVRDDSVEVEV